MRVLVMAPFERGRGQGGSLRATAIAERLEAREVTVEWQVVRRRALGPAGKLRAARRGLPVLSALYAPPATLAAAPDAILVAHSYLTPVVRRLTRGTPTVVDFHNLEWRHLLDGSPPGPATGPSGPLRWLWTRDQARLMRRVEAAAVAGADLSLFVSETEQGWAQATVPGAATRVAPSTLPAAVVRSAARIAAARDPRAGELAYVGTLTFPTNVASLERFLTDVWPALRAADAGLRLTVAGRCAPDVRERLARHPGVTATGFLEDLTPLLSRCQAVVMPFEGAAGTSLRTIFYALAGLPVIGSPEAFRGMGFAAGVAADRPAAWIAALSADGRAKAVAVARAAQADARRLQDDPGPWDALVAALEVMTRTGQARRARDGHVTRDGHAAPAVAAS
jgi:hypothetical protein